MERKRIALVLGGGGARGAAHIGVIEALEEAGFEIASVAGTSMGALVGGIYAAGHLEQFKEWICRMDRYKIFSMIDLAFSSEGLVKGDRVMKALRRMVPEVRIERLPIPFAAVATDLLTGREVVFDHGDLFDAIRSSISIPSVFRPVRLGGMLLIDGGTTNPVPLDRVVRRPGDLLVAVDASAPFSGLRRSVNYYSLLSCSSEIMIQRITSLMRRIHTPDLLIEIPSDRFGAFEFHRSTEICDIGRRMAEEALQQLAAAAT
ncbi:MAG: patatin-like phospholipase family protein [Alistipes sp.]|nr:patatin-like phospholipase family protein [Alistipes senegalensis]MCM1251139.1 patatin-like phospholipase family protein [Alistipes sp.]